MAIQNTNIHDRGVAEVPTQKVLQVINDICDELENVLCGIDLSIEKCSYYLDYEILNSKKIMSIIKSNLISINDNGLKNMYEYLW